MALTNKIKYTGNELKYLKKVLNRELPNSKAKNWTDYLEKKFAEKFQAKFAIGFNSGTGTMHAALLAAGVGPGDEVISPALTVIMNTTTTFHAGAIPVYADVNPKTFSIDPDDIEKKITPKTKAISLVNIYGLPCDMDPIMELAKKYNLFVLEDNAECFMSTYKGRLTGTIGHMGSYSFENSKHISCGEGGMLITNDKNLAENARKIGAQGFKGLTAADNSVKQNLDVFQNPNYERHDTIGWNYRLPDFLSAIALAQLEKLDYFIECRQYAAKVFTEAIGSSDLITPQFIPKNCTHSHWAFAARYNGENKGSLSWRDFRKKYIINGGDGIYSAWKPPYLEPVMYNKKYIKFNPGLYNNLHYPPGMCPIAEKLQKELLIFKTNYYDKNIADQKAESLFKTLKEIE